MRDDCSRRTAAILIVYDDGHVNNAGLKDVDFWLPAPNEGQVRNTYYTNERLSLNTSTSSRIRPTPQPLLRV